MARKHELPVPFLGDSALQDESLQPFRLASRDIDDPLWWICFLPCFSGLLGIHGAMARLNVEPAVDRTVKNAVTGLVAQSCCIPSQRRPCSRVASRWCCGRSDIRIITVIKVRNVIPFDYFVNNTGLFVALQSRYLSAVPSMPFRRRHVMLATTQSVRGDRSKWHISAAQSKSKNA